MCWFDPGVYNGSTYILARGVNTARTVAKVKKKSHGNNTDFNRSSVWPIPPGPSDANSPIKRFTNVIRSADSISDSPQFHAEHMQEPKLPPQLRNVEPRLRRDSDGVAQEMNLARLEKTSRPAEKVSVTRTLAERNRFLYDTFQEPEHPAKAACTFRTSLETLILIPKRINDIDC